MVVLENLVELARGSEPIW
ncbi:unnamed protein product [Victoria cruziana]